MKALTISQPWAKLIMEGGKDIENRDWPTSVRGRIAVHTSAKLSWEDYLQAELLLEQFRHDGCKDVFALPKAEMIAGRGSSYRLKAIPQGIHCGTVIGTVEIVDCVRASKSPWFFGSYGFVLKDPVVFAEPIAARGKLMFWDWDETQSASSQPATLTVVRHAEPQGGLFENL